MGLEKPCKKRSFACCIRVEVRTVARTRARLPALVLRFDGTIKTTGVATARRGETIAPDRRRRASRQWRIQLDMPLLGFSPSGMLVEWLRGEPLLATVRENTFSPGSGTTRTEAGLLSIHALPQFTLELRSPTRLDGQVQLEGKTLSLPLRNWLKLDPVWNLLAAGVRQYYR